ncbi:hypothetical protein [uncultured Algibacter sp.]|uniref:hypothetical protein n=1 Tax=uncultured Algibacter sp. TaxID=298659 RepID=UPI002632688B|nr:hypothetical protein [uncultured Algibacter sp.]
MDDIINGKNLDSILKYCLEKNKTDNGYTFIYELENKLFTDFNEDEIMSLIKYIDNSGYEVLEIYLTGNPCINITGLTERFLKNGGFTKIESDLKSDSDLKKDKESLDLEIKLLQKDKLQYEETIREQNDRIRDLTEKLKLISLIQKYWWVVLTCIGIGWSLGEVLDRLVWT